MVSSQEELLAATIRKQIAYLEGLLIELETHPAQNFGAQIRRVETHIRDLRSQLQKS